MTKVYNTKNTKAFRRNLRKNQTKAERVMWKKIRNRQLGYKFRRQVGIEKYIVDFFCSELKLVIEIDGDTHFYGKQLRTDKIREKDINKLEIKIIRFMNIDVLYNLNSVLDSILEECKRRKELIND